MDTACNLTDCGISQIVKEVNCNCFRKGNAYEHLMDNHCVDYMRSQIRKFEEAEIHCMTTKKGVKFIK